MYNIYDIADQLRERIFDLEKAVEQLQAEIERMKKEKEDEEEYAWERRMGEDL